MWFNLTNDGYQDTDDHEEADGSGSHEGEESVDGKTAENADAVDVVEVDLPAQQQQGSEGEAKSLKEQKWEWKLNIQFFLAFTTTNFKFVKVLQSHSLISAVL